MGSFLQRLSLLGLVVVIHGRRSDRGKGKRIESRVADICFSEQLLPFPIRSLIYMKEQAQTQGKRERERSFSRRVCGKEKSAASPVDEAPPPPTAQMATFSPALSPLSLSLSTSVGIPLLMTSVKIDVLFPPHLNFSNFPLKIFFLFITYIKKL